MATLKVKPTSKVVGVGKNVGLTEDIDGNVVTGAPTLGAFQTTALITSTASNDSRLVIISDEAFQDGFKNSVTLNTSGDLNTLLSSYWSVSYTAIFLRNNSDSLAFELSYSSAKNGIRIEANDTAVIKTCARCPNIYLKISEGATVEAIFKY